MSSLDYYVRLERTLQRTLVRISGTVTPDTSRELLEKLWNDELYLAGTTSVWDVGECELPDFDGMMRITQYIAKEKKGRGPNRSLGACALS